MDKHFFIKLFNIVKTFAVTTCFKMKSYCFSPFHEFKNIQWTLGIYIPDVTLVSKYVSMYKYFRSYYMFYFEYIGIL